MNDFTWHELDDLDSALADSINYLDVRAADGPLDAEDLAYIERGQALREKIAWLMDTGSMKSQESVLPLETLF